MLAAAPFLGSGSRSAITLASALFAVGSRGPYLLAHTWFSGMSSLPAWGHLGAVAVASSPARSSPPTACAFLLVSSHDSGLATLPALAGLPGLGVSAHLTGCSRLPVAAGPG